MTWFTVTNADELASPALLVFPDRVRANIRQTIQLAGGTDRLRPHVKTHKMRAVTAMLLAEGIQQFKCATLREARMLAEAGAPDILIAYALVGPAIDQFRQLRNEFPTLRFACLIDNTATARRLSDTFADKPVDVYLDLNVGMNRTGIKPANGLGLFTSCQSLSGIRVAGLQAYDGHIRDQDVAERKKRTDDTFAQADGFRQTIRETTGTNLELIMGGTPSFALHARQADVVVSPGTFVFWDAGYDQQLPDLPFVLAAVLLTRVISVIDEQTLCLDLGHKSVAAENPLPRVLFLAPEQPDVDSLTGENVTYRSVEPIGQSEEHLVVRVADAHQYPPGTIWYGVPIHICPTVNLYDTVSVIVDNRWVDTWAVTARGH